MRFVVAAGLALPGLMALNLLVPIFHVSGIGIREYGPLGILFSIAAIAVGCFFFLLLDGPVTHNAPGMSTGALPCRLRRSASAVGVGAGAGDRHADQYAPVTLHGRAVVLPVTVLAGDSSVVVDEALHRGG